LNFAYSLLSLPFLDDEVIPFFFENDSNQSNSIQTYIEPLKFDAQLNPDFISNASLQIPNRWSYIDWSIVGQTGYYTPDTTTNPGSNPSIESGTPSSGSNLTHQTFPSEHVAAATKSTHQTSKRVSHYRIEKRYRTNINDKIRQLDEMLPENILSDQHSIFSGNEDSKDSFTKGKEGTKRSKGEVLSLVIDYLVILQKKEVSQERRIRELEGQIWTSRNVLKF
jgi:hypothetical protein